MIADLEGKESPLIDTDPVIGSGIPGVESCKPFRILVEGGGGGGKNRVIG